MIWKADDIRRLEVENRNLRERLKHVESAIPMRGVQSSLGSQTGTISMPYMHIPVSGLDKLQGGSASRVVVKSRLRAAWLVLIGKADAVVWE
jgi:hypothetical protein